MLARKRQSTAPPVSHTAASIVTGERLQRLADVSLVSARTRAFHRNLDRYARAVVRVDDYAQLPETAIDQLSRARSLFVYTHELAAFTQYVWPRLQGSGYVLITHNSDGEIGPAQGAWLDAAGAKLTAWFAQNVTIEHPKLVPLPLGIANSMWPHGNLRVLVGSLKRARRRAPTETLFARYSPGTHAERAELGAALASGFPALATDHTRRISFREYLGELSTAEFCVCPRGNGIDTHRLWEALYLGVTPIVKRSTHTEHWCRLGLPLVIVDDWMDLTPALLNDLREAPPRLPAGGPLHLDYWSRPVFASMSEGVSRESTDSAGTPAR